MKGELFTFQNAANVGFFGGMFYTMYPRKSKDEKHSKIFEIFLDI